MLGIKKRRTLIRVLSYSISAFAIAVIMAVSGFVMAYKYRMNIEYSSQRALSELNDQVNNINLALQKGIYASTSAQLMGLAAEIWSDAGSAKADISQLSITDIPLEKTTKFISQTGDFANSLAKKIADKQPVTNQERATLQSLLTSSTKLSDELGDMIDHIQSGKITLFKTENALKASTMKQSVLSVGDSFKKIEENFSSLPSMIYDGPFSDNVMKKEPIMTKNQPQISKDDAKKAAANFLGVSASALQINGETAGNLPTYNFTDGSISIFVSKNGGYIVRMVDSRSVTGQKLDLNAALQKGGAFLNAKGFKSMTQTYTLINNNICMINYAFVQNGVTCYPDLMKVSVALDTGSIVSFDQTGMLMNHKTRTFPTVRVSRSSIQKLINPLLKVQSVNLALIPTADGQERLCYEFKCLNNKNQNVIDYFNVSTSTEEQILIVLNTPGGLLPV